MMLVMETMMTVMRMTVRLMLDTVTSMLEVSGTWCCDPSSRTQGRTLSLYCHCGNAAGPASHGRSWQE